MNTLGTGHLDLENCPQCQITKPLLSQRWSTLKYEGLDIHGGWAVYHCSKCRRFILAWAPEFGEVQHIWPQPLVLSEDIPLRVRKALDEATKIRDVAPSASIIQSQRAVELMLHEKGVAVGKNVTFNDKIKEAAANQIIIPAMADWANEIRWAANDERHLNVDDATPDQAHQLAEFALALAQNLFVLPARISRGLKRAKLGGNAIVTLSATANLQTS
jgi:hypothetical protein